MLQMLRKRLHKDEEGFTLIELMVVVLIIAILLAIAIPTFLGARSRAQNRAAESNLRNALTAEKTSYTDNQTYVDYNTVSSVEPSIGWQTAAAALTAGSNQVDVTLKDTNNVICLLNRASATNYFEVVDVATADATGGSYLTSGTFYASGDSTLACPTAIDATGAPTGNAGGTGANFGKTTSAGGW